MLKKENRLTTNFEFDITKKYGRYVSGKFSHVYLLKPKNYTGPIKVGIVISNKFDKSAAKRNYIKRLFRQSVGENFGRFQKNVWIVIYPKNSTKGKTYEEINSDFTQTIQKISLSS